MISDFEDENFSDAEPMEDLGIISQGTEIKADTRPPSPAPNMPAGNAA
jgi:hypothetical protein